MIKLNKKSRKIIRLFIICFLIGSLVAFIFYSNLNKDDLNNIINNIKENNILFNIENNSINHLKILSVSVLFSLIFIGLPIFTGILIGEGFNIFLKVLLIHKIYKFKGIIYVVLYLMINYGFYIFILFIIFKKILNIIKNLYKYKIKKETINYNSIYNNLVKCIILIIINFIFDYILFLYSFNLLAIFKQICKI
ncbi:MAG: hypothetical protein IKX00_03335 [Bacilli bacterium]|nr:hypothetical protein [Bacilli bacterium]